MARPRKEIDEAQLEIVKLATIKGAPAWAIEAIIGKLNDDSIEYLKENECKDLKRNISFLAGFSSPKEKKAIWARYKSYVRTQNFKTKDKLDRISNAINSNLRDHFLKNNIKYNSNSKSFLEFLLGYSIDDLCNHLESMFNDKMGWHNYGDYWQIDHVFPKSLLSFKSIHDDNFRLCWSLGNLQPLEKIENIKKSNKVIKKPKRGE